MVYWIAFPGELIRVRWYYIRYDTRILKGPLDKLIGRDSYEIFKAGKHPLLKEIKTEFQDKHSFHGSILEMYDIKHLVFLKTSLENFKSFTRHRHSYFQCIPEFYEVETEHIIQSEKLILTKSKKIQKRQKLQQDLKNLSMIRNAVKYSKVKEDSPNYVNNIITEHRELIPKVLSSITKLEKNIKKLEEEILQLKKDLMELWKKQRIDI